MKSRTLRKIIAATTLVLGVAISVTSSLSWFDETVKIETENVTGVSEGAYFHSGNGTKDYPYTITRKRHLYNLAWLQYLGYFLSKDSEGNIKSEQNTVYFRLLNNIDMDGMNIPPIGTSEYPFIGNFDGQGFKVTNFKTTNDYSDFTKEGQKHPYTVTTDNFKNDKVKIVGFFGVVGSIGDSANYTYDSEKNQVKNVGLDNFEVKSKATDTLVGLAAGYVNGELASVAVNNGKLNLTSEDATTALDSTNLTSNVSDYSIVGYATDPYKTKVTKVSQSAYKVTRAVNQEFVVQEEGDENAYGSSIDMKSVTERLQAIRNTQSNYTDFDFHQRYNYHDGVKDETPTAVYTDTTHTKIINNNDEIGHFNFLYRGDTEDKRYALMGGGHWEDEAYYEKVPHETFVIKSGNNYMQVRSTTINNATTLADASTWEIDGNQNLCTTYNNITYYLYTNNGTNLQVTTNVNTASKWYIEDSGSTRNIYTVYNNIPRGINYGTNWRTLVSGTINSYDNPVSIESGDYTGNYLSVNGTSINNSTTEQKIWDLSNLNGNTTISTIINERRYYLGRSSNGLTLSTTQTTWTYSTSGNYVRYYTRTNTRNYYLVYDYYDSWGAVNRPYEGYELYVNKTPTDITLSTNVEKTDYDTTYGPDEKLVNQTEGKMSYKDNDVTYFPLSTINNTNDFRPIQKNSAYVIAGSNITADLTDDDFDQTTSNVRFAYYDYDMGGVTRLKNINHSTGKFTAMYTITKSNNTLSRTTINETTNTYVRYKDAKEGLEKVIGKDKDHYYGLHFMDSAISENATHRAASVTFNKETYENFELPVNAIDFNLKEFGYINFIAASYYYNSNRDRNNSFFSIYQIERNLADKTTINKIMEITKVYQWFDSNNNSNESYSYVYQLNHNGSVFYTKPYKIIDQAGHKEWLYDSTDWSENQYVNSVPSGYREVFDTAVIKGNSLTHNQFDYYAYYFEIPMNDGEFCLGSVPNYNGCYLLYLDIAANAQNVARSVFTEYFLRTDEEFDFPVGVAIVSNVAIINTHTATTDQKVYASDSVTIVIKPGYQDELILSRDTSGAILTRSTTSSLAAPSYKEASLSLKENGTEVTEFEATRSTQYETIRNIIVDRDTRLQTTTITVIEENYIDGVLDGSRTVNQYSESIAEANLIPAADRVYYQLDPIKSTGKKIEESALEIIQPDKTNVLITYTYLMQDGSTSTSTFVLNFTKETDTNYYTANGYTINVTLTPAEDSSDTLVMTVTVLNKNGEVISINNITINSTGPVA